MFQILQVSRDIIREIFMTKKSLSRMIENCLIWRKKAKKNRRFSAGAAVPPQFLYSSILFSIKATAVQNFSCNSLWAAFMHIYFWFQKVAHPPPPFLIKMH